LGKAVRATERNTRAEKAGLENEAADTKTFHQPTEQREQTNPASLVNFPSPRPGHIQNDSRRGGVGMRDARQLAR
jgi:hypothetical protein